MFGVVCLNQCLEFLGIQKLAQIAQFDHRPIFFGSLEFPLDNLEISQNIQPCQRVIRIDFIKLFAQELAHEILKVDIDIFGTPFAAAT